MNKLLLTTCFILVFQTIMAQTTWQVCVEDPPSTTCPGKTGTFTPGNLVIQQGDMIQFTTTMVLLSGYSGTFHTIEFTGSPANNVNLLVSSDVFNQVTSVTTPPFNTPGVFPMECTNFNHCILSEYSCTGYTVTVLPNCGVSPGFTSSATTVCQGSTVDFTNTTTGATSYDWQIDGTSFASSTDAQYTFNTAGTFDINMVAGDGSCEDSTTITINVDTAANAGNDTIQSFCNINDSIDLNLLVDGDSGGIWQETTSSGQFNPATGVFDYTGLMQSTYYVNYIVTGQGVCPNDSAVFTIFVQEQPGITLNVSGTPIPTSDSVFVDFTATNTQPGVIYSWNFCDGNSSPTGSPFYYSWDTAGNYCVCVLIDNYNGCQDTDCDSTITVFDDSGIQNMVLHMDKLNVFPNPTSEMLNVDLTPYKSLFTLIITNVNGDEVLRKTVKGGEIVELDVSKFSTGIYNISVNALEFAAISQFILE